ncbi:trichohyalin-like [Engraulis encrasicolus]|uniref:trichohyalin-like n=1 Tax=Engraulis encrasicolus TaxID=184585 RepID=UPI002FCF86D7
MDRFSPALLGEIRPAVQRHIRLVVEAMEDDHLQETQALRDTLRHSDKQNSDLEAAHLQERERLQASVRQLNQQLQEVKRQASLIRADQASQTATGQAMISTMGRHLQELQDQLEKERRQAQERENEAMKEIEKLRKQMERERACLQSCDLLIIQRLRHIEEFKQQAERWMQTTMASGEDNTPVVFLTWGLREERRKTQERMPLYHDDLQAFLQTEELENHVREQLRMEAVFEAQCEQERQRLEQSQQERKQHLRAAAQNKQLKLQHKMEKEAQKRKKAAAKEEKRRKEKERKEKEKERKEAEKAAKEEKKREEKERKEMEKAAKEEKRKEEKEAERQERRERRACRCSLFSCFRSSATAD